MPLPSTPLTRRQFGFRLGAAGLVVANPVLACETGTWPAWADLLRRRLEKMAVQLTARAAPWQGAALVLTPEDYGHRPESPSATSAIQAAIDAAVSRGGGTVRLAQGDYVSGTIELRSHVRLEIAAGARLLASTDLREYPAHIARRPTVMDSNMGMNQSLIFAEGCDDIALAGEGTIDGRGGRENFPGEETISGTPGRPFLIRLIDCQRVHVQGLTLQNSPCWMQNYLHCVDLLIEGLTVENQANVNNDGCDIDGCRNVVVRNCTINAEDDGLCFKGAALRPTERVLVENCHIYSSCNALKLGTDSQSLFRDVLVRNVELGGPAEEMRALQRRKADSAISWEIVDGGRAENILCTGVRILRAASPLFLRLGDRGRVRPGQGHPPPGTLRRIVFDGLSGDENGARGSYFIGLPGHPIEDVALRNVALSVGSIAQSPPDQTTIPEMTADYPDAHMIKEAVPAYGLWVRHLDGLTLDNVTFSITSPDPRPMLLTDLNTRNICIK
jgi:hypothetical protein